MRVSAMSRAPSPFVRLGASSAAGATTRCCTTNRLGQHSQLALPLLLLLLLLAQTPLKSAAREASDSTHLLRAAAAQPPSPACAPDQLRWSGLCWFVRSESGGPCGETCFNRFSPKLVSVDSTGALNLEVRKLDGKWHSSEVYLNQSLGHGTYTWVMDSNPAYLDRNLVASSYVYADDTREYDVEFSSWGRSREGKRNNAQFTVQPAPHFLMDNQLQYRMDSSMPSTHTLTWGPSSLSFTSRWTDTISGDPRHLIFEYSGASADWTPGDEALHLSLWMFEQQAPAISRSSSRSALEAVAAATQLSLRCFEFCPSAGGGGGRGCVGELGCGR